MRLTLSARVGRSGVHLALSPQGGPKTFELEGGVKVAKAKTESEERDEEASARITGVAKIHGESPVQIDAIAVP